MNPQTGEVGYFKTREEAVKAGFTLPLAQPEVDVVQTVGPTTRSQRKILAREKKRLQGLVPKKKRYPFKKR